MPLIHGSSLGIPRRDLTGILAAGSLVFPSVGEAIYPRIPVPGITGRYAMLGAKTLNQRIDNRWPANSTAAKVVRTLDDKTYLCERYGMWDAADNLQTAMFGTLFDAEKSMVETLAMFEMREYDALVLGRTFNITRFPLSGNTGHTTAVSWLTSASCSPLLDIQTACLGIYNRIGLNPTMTGNGALKFKAVMTYKKYQQACRATETRNSILYTATPDGNVPPQVLAAMWGLNEVVVINGVADSANPGQALGTLAPPTTSSAGVQSQVTDDYVLVCIVNTSANPLLPSIGRTCTFEEGGGMFYADMYDDPAMDACCYRVRQCLDPHDQLDECGYIIDTIP